jgi:hypothetical protein
MKWNKNAHTHVHPLKIKIKIWISNSCIFGRKKNFEKLNSQKAYPNEFIISNN